MIIETGEYSFEGTCINVVDGDTIDIDIDLGFSIKYETRLRLFGINAYETTLRGSTTEEQKKKGLEAKALLQDLILDREIEICTLKGKKGKYGRYLAVVFFEGQDIGMMLVEKGLAVSTEVYHELGRFK